MSKAVPVTVTMAHNGSVRIAYETFGPPDGEPLLLVMGLGMQMLAWPEPFCLALADRGFAVARFDNRDVGLSTHLYEAGTPSLVQVLQRPAAVARYRLDDMADDALAVLDALGWASAHVVGVSLGGMIAQVLAIRHTDRVRTLTSIMSTPSPRIGRPTLRALRAMALPRVADREAAAQRMVDVFRVIGSPAYPADEAALREVAGLAYDRAHDPGGVLRQLAAIRASRDRREQLARLRIPALVLHGEADPLIRVAGGRATAAAIPGARLVVYPGMGHSLPPQLWSAIIDEICAMTGVGARPPG